MFVAALAGLMPIDVAAQITNIGTLSAFVLASLGVLILRRTQPQPDFVKRRVEAWKLVLFIGKCAA